MPLKGKGLNITLVQKQTRFKVMVATGDCSGHVSVGVKWPKEAPTAICLAFILAMLSIILVQWDYWGDGSSQLHMVTQYCGSVLTYLIPASQHCVEPCAQETAADGRSWPTLPALPRSFQCHAHDPQL